jgi:hypothetical protein
MATKPTVKPQNILTLIKWVASEQKFKIEAHSDTEFEIRKNRVNSVRFKVYKNTEYIQIHQWEDSGAKYGKAVYSIREYSDAIQFCNILIASENLRARRKDPA